MSGSFDVEAGEVRAVAGRLGEVTEALEAAARAAADLRAVSGTNPGFTAVTAALDCATTWLDEVARLGGRVDGARAAITDSAAAYQLTDEAARPSFTGWGD